MDWKSLKQRFSTVESVTTANFTLPPVLLEIQPDFVVAVRLVASGKRLREVRRIHVTPLAPAAVVPNPSHANIAKEDAVREVATSAITAIGNGGERLGLLLSDAVARVAVLSFETLPDDRGEAEALVRWRLGEGLPYPAEEARVSYQVAATQPNHVEVLAIAGRNSVLTQYQAALGPGSGSATLVLPATLALLPLVPERLDVGQLVVHLCCGWVTTVVLLGSRICFWRTREVRPAPEDLLSDVATEAARVMAGSLDHLQVKLGCVWLCARPSIPQRLKAELARVTGCPVKELAPDPALPSLLVGEERQLFERYGAAVAGLVQNVVDGRE
jgi:type IV pilus assembly protein PilM